ncbi:MAG TPA: hypothetical protein VKV17_20570 [Bryobacteraceae bacterium]|nr:hypothetical protein [Bryobacteraceae bacterium]
MNCDRFRKQLSEFGALDVPGDALAHLGTCAGCAVAYQRQRKLETGLKQLAAAQAEWSAPAYVEAALLERFRSESPRPAPPAPAPQLPFLFRFRIPALLAAGALAAALALLVIARAPQSAHIPEKAVSQVAETEDDSAVDNGFIMLPYFANSGEVANTSEDDVVRVVMPRSALVSLGVPVTDDSTSGSVEAELLLGQGGVPQAVRVLE